MTGAIKAYHPNLKEFKKIYSCTQDGYSLNTIYEKCKNHAITLLLIKSNFQKILGGYTQTEWKDYNGKKEIPSNSSFIFFYDDDNFRKCPQKNTTCYAHSDSNYI
jgi:hypothetical protein